MDHSECPLFSLCLGLGINVGMHQVQEHNFVPVQVHIPHAVKASDPSVIVKA